MTEQEAIEWLAPETSPMKIHMAELQKENPMKYINEAVEIAIKALEEIQQYRELGTVEELKEARGKQIAKKPLPIITDDNEFICVICPTCQRTAVEVDDLYCRKCWQKLDWGNEDES